MKITRTELARIVKEETEAYMSEQEGGGNVWYERFMGLITSRKYSPELLAAQYDDISAAFDQIRREFGDVANERSFREGAEVREEAGEGVEHPQDKLVKDVQTLVDQGIELMSMEDPLKKLGYDAVLNSSMDLYFVEIRGLGQKYIIISKNKINPDSETKFAGKYAIGAMD